MVKMSDGKMFVIVFRGRQTGLPRFENSRNVEMTESVGDQQAANPFGSEY
jgi:hypothetical protein